MSKTPRPISAKEFGKLYDAAEKRRASAPAPKKTEREDIGMAEAKRRAHAEATRGKRMAWLKGLGIVGLVIAAVWGWFGRGKSDKNNDKTNVVVHQWFVDNGNAAAPDFYDYDEPVYHPQNGRVSFEVPLPNEHPVSSSAKTAYHESNAGIRDVVYDAGATVDSVTSFAGSVADVLGSIGDIENAHHRTGAERERLKRQKAEERARAERARARAERSRIDNERARQNMEMQRRREAEREAERLRRIREQEAQRLERERRAARQAAERAAAAQRKAAEAAARKAEAERRRAEAEARRLAAQARRRKKRVGKQTQRIKSLDKMVAAAGRRLNDANAKAMAAATRSNGGASKA